MATQAPAVSFPARAFMRPQLFNLGSQAFVLGGNTLRFPLRALGYLSKLLVHVSGTYTVANADLVFLAFAPWNLVRLFTIVTPQSPLTPINAGGLSMHRWNLIATDYAPWRQAFATPPSGTALDPTLGTTSIVGGPYNLDLAPTYDALDDQAIVTIGAEVLHLWWTLPFALSVSDIRGVLPLGNSTVTELQVTPNTTAAVVTVAANFTTQVFTCEVIQELLSPPPAGAPITDPGSLSGYVQASDETFQAVTGPGLQLVTIVPNYTILGIMHNVSINSIDDSSQYDLVNLRMNSSRLFDPPGISGAIFARWMAATYGRAVPEGETLFDFDILGQLGWVQTAQLTELQSELTIDSGANIVAGDGILTSVRRLVGTPGA